jgi:recombinational DNA repair protein RecR
MKQCKHVPIKVWNLLIIFAMVTSRLRVQTVEIIHREIRTCLPCFMTSSSVTLLVCRHDSKRDQNMLALFYDVSLSKVACL